MNTRYTILSVAAAALALTACSNEDELSLQQGDEVVKIASASVVNSAQTRVNSVGTGDTFDSGDSFCLINKSRPSQNKGTYATTDGTNWTQSGGLVLWASGTNDFSAYMPATAAIEPFLIPEDQSTIEKLKSADYMTATASVEKGGDVNLQFAHQLTKVTLNISYTSQYTGNEVVSALKIVKIPNSTPNNNLIKQAGEGYVPYPFVANKTLSEVAQQNYTAIVCPGSYFDTGTYSYFLTMTIGGTEVKLKANNFLQTYNALQAGKAYTFNVQVGDSQANVSTVSVRAWTESALDEVEPENPYTTVTLVPRADSENGRFFTAWNTNDEVFTTALTADYVKVTGTMPSVVFSDGWYDLYALLQNSQKLKTLDLSATTATTMSRTSLFQSQSVETIIMPATLTSITENNFSQCPNLQVVDLSLCTSVPNVDSYSAFKDNGENGMEDRLVTVYVASGMKNEFSNYYPDGNWYNTPWDTLENENRIKIVEKQTVQVYSVNRER